MHLIHHIPLPTSPLHSNPKGTNMFRPLFISCLLISFGGISSSHPEELQVFFQFFFKVYKNGTIEKLDGHGLDVPASLDSETGVQTKDIIIISHETNVSAHVYATKDAATSKGGVPLLVYFHSGGFSTGSAAYYAFHQFVSSVVAKGKVVAVSVSYRLAPEHCLSIGYDDSWAAVKWVGSHAGGGGTEPWLKERVDFNSVYFLGESAGANIAHNMAMRFGSEKLDGVELKGIVLIHPYFLLKEPTRSLLAVNEEKRNNITKLWPHVCPSTSGPSDPRVNPVADPDLKKLGGKRVLICLAEQDPLLDAGKKYGQALRREGGKVVKKFVSKGKSHVFHLREPNSKEALDLIDRVASFVNGKSKKTQLGMV